MLRECSNKTGLDIKIFGPETHITAVVPLALGLEKLQDFPQFDDPSHLEPSTKKMKYSNGEIPNATAAGGEKGDANGTNDSKMKRVQSFHGQIADHEWVILLVVLRLRNRKLGSEFHTSKPKIRQPISSARAN